jgi:hypothetical protein
VTGPIAIYKDRPFTIAHALTAVYSAQGVEAMNEAARAFATFKIWAPNSEVNGMYPIDSFNLKGSQIATAIWPESKANKAEQVRRLTRGTEEMAEEDVAKKWPEIHMRTVATVTQSDSLPGEYPAVEVIHEDPEQDITKIDLLLTGDFFMKFIVPALKTAWPGVELDIKALWLAVMTDGESREDPWTKDFQQGSSLGQMPRAKQKRKLKVKAPKQLKAEAKAEAKVEVKDGGAKKKPAKKRNAEFITDEPEDLDLTDTDSNAKLPRRKKPKAKEPGVVKNPRPTTTKPASNKTKMQAEAFLERLRAKGPTMTMTSLTMLQQKPDLPDEVKQYVDKLIKDKAPPEVDFGDLAKEFGL